MPGKMTVSKWVKKEHHNLARLRKDGEWFEVSINPDPAIELKKGKEVSMEDVLHSKKIFADVRKGLASSEISLKKAFGTADIDEIARKIVKEGEISLTSEYREQLRENKRKQIVNMIVRNALDPKTKLPHPAARIEAAMNEAKVKIDEYRTAEEQIEDIIKKLRPIIPIKIEKEEIDVRIPARYAASAYPAAKSFGTIKSQRWEVDGSWHGIMEVAPGMLQDMIDRLNHITHGGIEINIRT
jgi:ribosome maturation protein SDO1